MSVKVHYMWSPKVLILIECIYVDDMIFTINAQSLIKKFKQNMMRNFEMTNLGLLHYFLGIEIIQDSHGTSL